ncbi:hypothetical protein [Galactobacter caseinivorans]|uniref:DUF308 domain-containing protein n=1 Tax=Galactobacter caseinivorans TaxID=2676123 RepID=A0A496PHS5_9MICC|nr:hypothetical protein [Galactobacter caseinivorans]RKW70046.1 hypothetical protein DWQ67_08745 [Galactobacter caseinivorans]
MSSTSVTSIDLARVLWKPTIYRGTVAILFSLLGIFWVSHTPAVVLAVALGLLFLLWALIMWPVTRLTGLPQTLRTGITAAALAWLVAGVMALFVREPAAAAFIGAFGLILGGGSELVAGVKERSLGRPARDFSLTGGISALGGVVLVLVAIGMGEKIDAHGIFGTCAMIVVLLGVHLLIAGLSYRSDSRKADAAAAKPTEAGS